MACGHRGRGRGQNLPGDCQPEPWQSSDCRPEEKGGEGNAVCPWGSRCQDNSPRGSEVSGQQAESLQFWELRVLPVLNTEGVLGGDTRAPTVLMGRPAAGATVVKLHRRLPWGAGGFGLASWRGSGHRGRQTRRGIAGAWSQNRRDTVASCSTGGQVATALRGRQLGEGPVTFGKSSKGLEWQPGGPASQRPSAQYLPCQ